MVFAQTNRFRDKEIAVFVKVEEPSDELGFHSHRKPVKSDSIIDFLDEEFLNYN